MLDVSWNAETMKAAEAAYAALEVAESEAWQCFASRDDWTAAEWNRCKLGKILGDALDALDALRAGKPGVE